ncbi:MULTISPECIES: ABC transporter substrate-binding protein [unclassified Rathayibacter]|uniref:ABC transporter substrate-binding protein n=1 Tax=unclassified Rathayibacter TaxID=2609250 RepID=UPI000F4BA3C5|nr:MULTISPECIES: extracellular solute-binding protein [unclassified Rathayibacter]MCJ1704395.1 extracellular solute-binding protein [Rathayibacter sp. VKM Ac-2926]ROP43501.1 carbohydrate ABC transporter substrate-binding protein (CUT1 family) [Rathayibacter sp. PhB186]ROS46657.1 carbohydrate ABC transporter substrate-binding protein (CUT1 family) [Rathayibacter sp. PhB185]
MPLTTTALSRRTLLTAAGAGAAALGLAACASPSGSGGVTEITFFQSKPEVIGYFDEVIDRFHAAQSRVRVVHDFSSNLSAGFVRTNPPDLGCLNYNFEVARFVERGALSDLSDMAEAKRINPDLQPLIEQTASYPGRTSVLPYSLMMSAVLYNREIFAAQNLEVPTTWTEFLAVCDALTAAGITPIYGTYKDPWTVAQGLFDYSVGGTVDLEAFFSQLKEQGADVGPSSPVSFEKDFAAPVDQMVQLAGYAQPNAASRAYGDGNLAFSNGEAAMYFQGPWALSEIAKTAPDLSIGAFPLPMTDDPDERRVRVNVDLALWIPEASTKKAAAREFLSFLMQPEIIDAYNADNNAFGVTTDAPAVTQPTLVELQEFYDRAAFSLGASQLVPQNIPLQNYVQGVALGSDPAATLRTIDADWARIAFRS